MNSAHDHLVEIDFAPDLASADMAYSTIGALTDMALSAAGATIADLDLCDTALRELLEVLAQAGPVLAASIDPTSGVLEIACAHALGPIPAESLELIDLGFGDLVTDSDRVRCSFLHMRGLP